VVVWQFLFPDAKVTDQGRAEELCDSEWKSESDDFSETVSQTQFKVSCVAL